MLDVFPTITLRMGFFYVPDSYLLQQISYEFFSFKVR